MVKSTKWTDGIVMVLSLIVIGLSIWWMAQNGVFNLVLNKDARLTWHLERSAGIVAYILLLASMVWGLFISGHFVKNWSPGPVSLTMHSTISWLALLLGMGHGLLLMFDKYFTYTLADIFVPFKGPYRPEVVALGTLAFWLIVIVTLSFPLKKHIGHKTWRRVHYASYAAFGLVSAHGLLAGTDGTRIGFQLLIGIGLVAVVLLLAMRISQDQPKPAHKTAPNTGRLSRHS